MLDKITRFIFGPTFYKIVRVYDLMASEWSSREFRQSCYMPLNHPCCFSYEKGKWTRGNDIFIFTELNSEKEMETNTIILASSFSYINHDEEDYKTSHFELWECRVGKVYKVYGPILGPFDFLNDMTEGKKQLLRTKFETKSMKSNNLHHQLVTNKIKLTKKIFEHRCPTQMVNF